MVCQTDGVWSITTAECISTTNTTEVNHPPHAIYPSSFMVPEDSLPGVTLGTLHTADTNNHESYVYTLTSDPSDKFYIEASDNTLRTHGKFTMKVSKPQYVNCQDYKEILIIQK